MKDESEHGPQAGCNMNHCGWDEPQSCPFAPSVTEPWQQEQMVNRQHEHRHDIPVEWANVPVLGSDHEFPERYQPGRVVLKLRCICGDEISRNSY